MTPTVPPIRVLLVEDSDIDAITTTRMVNSIDPTAIVDHASDYPEAIAALAVVEYDLAILDFMLPEGHLGTDVAKAAACPMIFVTGWDIPSVRAAMQDGVVTQIVEKGDSEKTRRALERFLLGPAAAIYRISRLSTDSDVRHKIVVDTFDALNDGVAVVAEDGGIIFANHALASISRWPISKLIEMNVDDLVPPGVQKSHETWRKAFGEKPVHRPMSARKDITMLRRDGARVPVVISLTPISGGITIATVREGHDG